MKFFVSRQKYWGVDEEEGTIVEVCQGGRDFANPDMLCAKWPRLGEGKEFTDPREAVESAIAICNAWRADGETNAKVAMGATGGFTLPFEGQDEDTLRKRAEELYEKLPKCDECGEVMGQDNYTHDLCFGDENLCSDYCAGKNYRASCQSDETEEEVA